VLKYIPVLRCNLVKSKNTAVAGTGRIPGNIVPNNEGREMNRERRFKRFDVAIMNIKGRMALGNMVRIKDLHNRGASLCADVRLNIGGEYYLKFHDEVTDLVIKGIVESSLLGESIVTSNDDVTPLYCADITFTNVTADAQKVIEKFVDQYKKEQELKLSNFRVSMDKSEERVVDIIEDYRVKKISLGGMLIECGSPYEIGLMFPMVISLFHHTPLNVTGRVASCLPAGDESAGRFDVGIEFRVVSDKNSERLKEFLRLLENPDEAHVDIWKQEKGERG
jgi:hypothetical protein